jgi:rod shape-determining protein MreC
MPDRRRRRPLLAVLVLVSLVLLTIDYRQGETGMLAAVQRGALAVFGPVQEGLAGVTRPVGDFISSVGQLGQLRRQNAELEAELQQLRDGTVSLAQLRQENAELRDLLRMQRQLGYTTTGAQVIAQPPGSFEWSVLIDVGAANGVEVGMPVVNGEGLVGKVTEVTARNARVQLAISPNARYAVRLTGSQEQGFLTGRGNRPLELQLLDPEGVAEPGQEVVTQTFRGSTIPDGIPIGIVEIAPEEPPGVQRRIAVRPLVDFSSLRFVQVVLDPPEVPADLDPDEVVEPADPPRPPRPSTDEEPPPTSAEDPPATEPEDGEPTQDPDDGDAAP